MKKLRLLLDKIKKINRTHLLIAGLFGILLLVIAMPIDQGGNQSKNQGADRNGSPESKQSPGEGGQSLNDQEETAFTYQEQLEQRLAQVLSQIEGVGKVSVMITLKDNGETQVEKDISRTEERTAESDGAGSSRESGGISLAEETVYDQTDSSVQTPFVKKITFPQVEGVLVVAEGAGNATVVKNISDAILALFPVEAHRIRVVRMK